MPNRLPLVTTDGLIQQVQASDNLKVPGFLALGTLTQAEIDALTPSNGVTVYNETNKQFEIYENGEWKPKLSTSSVAKDLYISTTGNDTTGDGSSGNPWASIDKALEYLDGFVLTQDATIHISRGSYTGATSPLNIRHPQGDKISIAGEYFLDTVVFSSVSGWSGNYTYILSTSNTSEYTYLDYVLVYESVSTASNEISAFGVLQVVGIHPGVAVHLKSINTSAASGGTFSVSIPQVKWARPINITAPLKLLSGIHHIYDVTGEYDTFIGIDQVLVGMVTIQDNIAINTHASQTGWNRNFTNTGVALIRSGFYNFKTGWFCGNAAALAMNRSGSTYCTNGIWSYSLSGVSQVYSHCVRCTLGLNAQYMSIISLGGGYTALSGNTTNASPANGTVGNDNSTIVY